jgi:phosphate-selective porin OprO/OprP
MLRKNWGPLGAVSLVAILAAQAASAQTVPTSDSRIDQLQTEVKTLEHELQGLKGRTTEAGKAYATATPLLTKAPVVAGAVVQMSPFNRPSICTADLQNCIGITSRIHVDAGDYWYRPDTTLTTPQKLDNGPNVRRARIGLTGTFNTDWNFQIVYDFGGSSDGLPPVSGAPVSGIENAFIGYTGIKPVVFDFGYMDTPYTLDEMTSSNDVMLMERPSPQVIATSFAGSDARAAAGLHGNTDRFWTGAYLTGPLAGTTHIFSPTATAAGSPGTLGSPGFAEQIGAVSRASFQLLQEKNYSLHIGADASFVFNAVGANTLTLSDRPEVRIDPTVIMTTGSMTNIAHAQVYSGEAAGGYGPLYVQGEYFQYNVERLNGLPTLQFDGWYVQAGWSLTGETRKYNPLTGGYNGIVPDSPFSLAKGKWGAWEIVGRYSRMDLNDLFTPGIAAATTNGVAGGVQEVYAAGLNWNVSRNVRFMLNYVHGDVAKCSGVAPLGADIGAKFNAVATRAEVFF